MKAIKNFKCFVGLFFLISIPQWVIANDGKPVLHFSICHLSTPALQMDTVPPKVKSPDNVDNNKPVEAIIKVVPKARKQVVPIPVSIPVKPSIIIKPKIIKPIIKVLH